MAKKRKTNEDLPNENQETNDASDNFGLPDIEYKPLDRVEEVVPNERTVEPEHQPSYKETDMSNDEPQIVFEEEEKSNSNVVLGLVIVLVIALGGFLVYKFVYVPRQLAAQEQADKDAAAKARADAEAARLAQQQEDERARLEAEAAKNAKPAIGTIETLSARTGRYYVVISSAIDGDLIMDRAKAVSPKGVSTKIIPPFAKWKFFRLTIGDYDTYAIAQTNADAAKADYGSGVWVIKY